LELDTSKTLAEKHFLCQVYTAHKVQSFNPNPFYIENLYAYLFQLSTVIILIYLIKCKETVWFKILPEITHSKEHFQNILTTGIYFSLSLCFVRLINKDDYCYLESLNSLYTINFFSRMWRKLSWYLRQALNGITQVSRSL
jgi:hypothetical protein